MRTQGTTVAPRAGATIARHAAATPEQLEEQARTLLGRYRVLETRGSGGFGTVEVCWDTRLQRRVAVKCMPLAGPDGSVAASTMDEALSEARYASRLSHPNIVGVHDFEWDGDYAYLVMEYVDGLTLGELLARVEGGVLTPDECAHLLDGIASALAYAHENRVLHLDIKPANIMVDRSGTPKLGDFGMATLASAAGYGDARGGTVGYMPPEQVEGALVDERCDLFALAVCVVQALTGRRPFAAPTAEQSLKLISRGTTDALAQVGLECGPDAADALRAALEPDPAYRTPSVERFADEAVGALGDADEGLASLRSLLGQLDDEGDGLGAVYHGVRLPLAERAPWLPALAFRLATAAACAWAGWVAGGALALAGPLARVAPALVCAACGAALAPLGAGVSLACLVAALVMGDAGAGGVGVPDAAALALLVVALGAWWALVARRSRPGALALLAPCALGAPVASVALGAGLLGPAGALATTALSWLLSLVLDGPLGPVAASGALLGLASEPARAVLGAGLALASCAGAALASRGTRATAVAGQVVAFALALGAMLVAARVENGGIWAAPEAGSVAVALLLCVFMCIAAVSFGPSNARQET